MSWLVGSAALDAPTLAARCREDAALARWLRRFDLPTRLALAAAREASGALEAPREAALVALAPCRGGSPELLRWVERVAAGGSLAGVRINPVHTLHAVDNLALSALAIELGNHAWGLGLGGAAGQAWAGLEIALERLAEGPEREALLLAGEQDDPHAASAGAGVALALSATPPAAGPRVRLCGLEREPGAACASPVPDAAAGLRALLAALTAHTAGPLRFEVPPEHGDGLDRIEALLEVEP